jgi:hypothetical protein
MAAQKSVCNPILGPDWYGSKADTQPTLVFTCVVLIHVHGIGIYIIINPDLGNLTHLGGAWSNTLFTYMYWFHSSFLPDVADVVVIDLI